jgi:hypothetical protein
MPVITIERSAADVPLVMRAMRTRDDFKHVLMNIAC